LKKDFDGMYRHCLIQNSKRGVDLVAPDESMIDPCRNIAIEAIEVARDMFMNVYGRDAKDVPLQQKPEFECRINTSCKKYSSAQKAQKGESADSASSSKVVDIEGKQVLRASFSSLHTYTADTGAAMHVKDKKELGPEEMKRVQSLHVPISISTANGDIVVDKYIEAQIQKLGGCRTFRMLVLDSPNLISIGQLVLEDGCSFFWNSKGPQLITPEGDVIELVTKQHVPEFTSYENIVNKINEIEGYAKVDEKSRRQSRSRCATVTPRFRPLVQDDLGELFFLEIFAGSGRLSNAVDKLSKDKSGGGIKTIRIEIKDNPDDDILSDDCWMRIQALI
ncbi:MAG: hypothetical protein QGH82_08415, partial [Candidatus Woesearchaeota archaeon]|nr:hypothetical protein [Candidatus Woesearchaeota archaeon]